MSKSVINSRIETPLDAAAAIALCRVLFALNPDDEDAWVLFSEAYEFAADWGTPPPTCSYFFWNFGELKEAYFSRWTAPWG